MRLKAPGRRVVRASKSGYLKGTARVRVLRRVKHHARRR
jgi:hypothetical protein